MPQAVVVTGLSDVERRLVKLAQGITNLRRFWPRVARLHRQWMIEQFATEGGFGGDAWEQLSDAYAAWKSEKYPNKGILQATGDLRRAALAPKRIATPKTLTLLVQEDGRHHEPVIDYHQEGTPRMPARPLLFGDPMPSTPRIQLDTLAEEYAQELVVKLGLSGMRFTA